MVLITLEVTYEKKYQICSVIDLLRVNVNVVILNVVVFSFKRVEVTNNPDEKYSTLLASFIVSRVLYFKCPSKRSTLT